jgi:CRISPR-associated protein Cmr2
VVTDIVVSDKSQSAQVTGKKFTVITFAPVQGFIEKSRKLRDLYGASQILSYLSWKIVCYAKSKNVEVISPAINHDDYAEIGNTDIVQGMPNRILLKGNFSSNDARKALLEGWKEIIIACRDWLKDNLSSNFPEIANGDGWASSWTRWQVHGWEVFWGSGIDIKSAMRDLETRKLRRDWTVPNWNGESSSLSGHDAIAHPKMDYLGTSEAEIKRFYKCLAQVLDSSKTENDFAYINENERLSIPELIKRLVTYPEVASLLEWNKVFKLGDPKRIFNLSSFNEILRKDEKSGYWTGWFMGDGDKVGDHLKSLTDPEDITYFSRSLRRWGGEFKNNFDNLGRVVYAGGDDFLGVMYGDKSNPQRTGHEAIDWLIWLRQDWESHNLGITLSVGFVWAGHSVPQRDVLQHCREAEKRSKNLGRDRVTIRIVFNNGQFVEWTTPWEYLSWLKDYRDRDGNTGQDANWSHVYGDLAQLKARHAIPPISSMHQDSSIALSLFKLYFGDENYTVLFSKRSDITNTEDPKALIQWIESMIKVGWQLLAEKNDV